MGLIHLPVDKTSFKSILYHGKKATAKKPWTAFLWAILYITSRTGFLVKKKNMGVTHCKKYWYCYKN